MSAANADLLINRYRKLEAERDALRVRLDQARELIREIAEWVNLPECPDGLYWIYERARAFLDSEETP